MTISRGQMPRQMYGLGSLVKSITKPIKKVVKGVGKIAKSPVGLAALTLGGAGLMGMGPLSRFATGPGLGLKNFLGSTFIGAADPVGLGRMGFETSTLGKFLKSPTGIISALTIPSVLAAGQVPEMEGFEEGTDKEELARYLRRYYKNLNQNASDEEVEAFVRDNLAEGGRIGYAEGNPDEKQMAMIEDMLKRGMDMSTIKSITGASDKMIQDRINFIKYGGAKVPIEKAKGGRIGFAKGDTAEQNAIQAAGIEGLPLNKNPAGITELDLRETGGFIPPVGVKEKADDIPAMLSNNEFVMTAKAVKEFGDGDVDKGAERMYAMMKTLENGGRV